METYTPKGFFDKPEGKMGMVFIVLGIFAFLVFGNTIMPYIITALQNTIHAAILGAIVLGTIWLLMNKKFRLLCWNLYKTSMRFITSMFVTIDPIGIMKNYIEYMREKIEEMDKNIGILGGQKQSMKRTIDEKREEAEENARLLKEAKRQNNAEQMTVLSRKIGRAVEFVDNLGGTLAQMERMYLFLDKMKRNVSLLLDDTIDEVDTQEKKYKAIKAAHKAMSTAQRLIAGDEARELFDQSVEFVADDIANKIGEMERAMEASKNFMESVDLQNGVWDSKGIEILEKLENGGSLFSYETNKSNDRGLTPNFGSRAFITAPKSTETMTSSQLNPNFEVFFKKPEKVEQK